MLLFYTPWKHQKTLRFSDVFWGYRKATPGCNGFNVLTEPSQQIYTKSFKTNLNQLLLTNHVLINLFNFTNSNHKQYQFNRIHEKKWSIMKSYIFSSKILAVESCTENFGIHLVILINYSWTSLTTAIKKNTHSSLCWMSIYKLKMIYCW